MKKIILVGLIALSGVGLGSCEQDEVVSTEANSAINSARLGSDTTGFFCRDSLTSIEVSALPAALTDYVSAGYAGATIDYAAQDDAGNFLVAITQNGQRKALLFNADGSFNRALSPRGGGKGRGHRGGDRDRLTKVVVTDLPAVITDYVTTTFAGATITAAALDATRGYLVMLSENVQRRTLLFNADGTFSEEIVRRSGKDCSMIAASALPAAVTACVNANYAGATIQVAGQNNAGQFKVIVQPTAGRVVELLFAADGSFVQARTRR